MKRGRRKVASTPSYVRGKSTQELINMSHDELKQLSSRELREVSYRVVHTGRERGKRIKNYHISKLGVSEKQAQEYYKEIESIRIRGKSDKEIIRIIERVRDFITLRPSTVKQQKQAFSTAYKKMGMDDWTNEERIEFFEAFKHLSDPLYMDSPNKAQFVKENNNVKYILIEKVNEHRRNNGDMTFEDYKNIIDNMYVDFHE